MNLELEENKIHTNKKDLSNEKVDYTIDFTTSSSISKIGIKFLALYIVILWISGYMAVSVFFDVSLMLQNLTNTWIITMLLLPVWLFILYFIFIFGVAFFSKLFLVIINMIYKPREGVFKAEEGNKDFEFWRVRVELKKLALWLMNNSPLPWIVMWGFRWFGVRIDFSSHLQDAWVDTDFIDFGRQVTIGQASVVMSSMVIGKYLIIKKVIFGDYTVVGGVSNISPGTIYGNNSVTGAFTNTNYNQRLESGWIYIGLPAQKYKPNKYAEYREDKIYRKDADTETKYEVKDVINIDEGKKKLALGNNNKKEKNL